MEEVLSLTTRISSQTDHIDPNYQGARNLIFHKMNLNIYPAAPF